jgi:hypothetical protein
MNYFKWLSLILGSAMAFGGLWTVLCREQAGKFIEKIYPEKKPAWVNLSSFAALVLAAATWYLFLTHLTSYAFVVTFVATLTFLKVILVACVYPKYREFLSGLFAEPVALRAVTLSAVAVGAALLFLGLFF